MKGLAFAIIVFLSQQDKYPVVHSLNTLLYICVDKVTYLNCIEFGTIKNRIKHLILYICVHQPTYHKIKHANYFMVKK